MKKYMLLTLCLITVATVQAQVKFENKSTDALREMAVQANKLVFIDLYDSWCAPCRLMDREVFSRKDVGDLMEKWFVCARYNTSKEIGKALLRRYGNNAIPLFLIFDTKGELLGRIQGAAPPEKFMDEIRTVLQKLAQPR